jgi:AcrR family transcriptional regulator
MFLGDAVEAAMNENDICERGPRVGRPPTVLAGEVEARILEAAARVFLARGFDGASIGEIAEVARAGKATIYARYPDKEALFAAAFLRRLSERNARFETFSPTGETVEDRLASIGVVLIEESLSEDFLDLMRLAIAEGRRRPDLARQAMGQARERGRRMVAHLLMEGVGEPLLGDEERAMVAARFFAEIVLVPLLMRALAKEDLSELRAEAAEHVKSRARFFLAALKNGGLGA